MCNLMRTTLLIFAMISFPAYGAIVEVDIVPTSWKLENYVGSVVVAWYTGSPCTNGLISFASVTESEKNRFWSVVLASKVSGRSMFVRYDNATSGCPINSFGMR